MYVYIDVCIYIDDDDDDDDDLYRYIMLYNVL